MNAPTAMRPLLAALDRLIPDQRGAGAVEFAFVIPIALLLTIGGMEVARGVSAQAAINQAAKETARFASVRGAASRMAMTAAEVEAMAVQLADLSPDHTSAVATWDPDNRPGSVMTVTIQHDFTPVTAFFDHATFTLNATASMTIVR